MSPGPHPLLPRSAVGSSGTQVRSEIIEAVDPISASNLLPEIDMTTPFTILHTNDMQSSLLGMGPAPDYTPFGLGDDNTRGGYVRLAALIAQKKEARAGQGPELVLDAGDFSMGTPFCTASRETGGEPQLVYLMGYDAITLGPDSSSPARRSTPATCIPGITMSSPAARIHDVR